MKLTKDHLKKVQVELFFDQIHALEKHETELNEHFNIARNLACSDWEYGPIPSVSGGRDGLRTTRIIRGEALDLLQKNFDKQRDDISYRRYALIKAYYPLIKDRLGGSLLDCYEFWETTTEV